MNEKEFIKKLNNKNNNFFINDVRGLISQTTMLDVPKKENIFRKIFSKFSKKTNEKSAEQIISDNFEKIIERVDTEDKGGNLMNLFSLLIRNPVTQNIVKEKIDFVLDKINTKDFGNTRMLYNDIKDMPNFENTLIEHIDTILKHITEPRKLFELSQSLKGKSEDIDNKLNRALEENKLGIVKSLLDKAISEGPRKEVLSDFLNVEAKHQRLNEEEKEQLLNQNAPKVLELIEKLLTKEQKTMIDITQIGEGSYCEVYQIGSKVLKFGPPREIENTPIEHPRILKPLLKTNLVNHKNNDTPFECVEVSDKAEKVLSKECQEEDMYEVYKELRKDGIIWTDVKLSNLGKVNGQLVIIDLDYLYSKDSSNIEWPEKRAQNFEKRYLQEGAAEISKEFNQNQYNNSDNRNSQKDPSIGKE